MSATNRLTTRVSDEVKEKFDEQRNEMGLSANQFLKFLVLAVQEVPLPDIPDSFTEEQAKDEFIAWLRGK